MKKVASGLKKIVLIRKIYMSRKRRVDMMIEESPTYGSYGHVSHPHG